MSILKSRNCYDMNCCMEQLSTNIFPKDTQEDLDRLEHGAEGEAGNERTAKTAPYNTDCVSSTGKANACFCYSGGT
jgi:hypothetical protein